MNWQIRMVIVSSAWCLVMADPFLSVWSQTCKIHADTKHDEFKDILQAKEKFNVENWSHATLLAVVVLLSAIILTGGCI